MCVCASTESFGSEAKWAANVPKTIYRQANVSMMLQFHNNSTHMVIIIAIAVAMIIGIMHKAASVASIRYA